MCSAELIPGNSFCTICGAKVLSDSVESETYSDFHKPDNGNAPPVVYTEKDGKSKRSGSVYAVIIAAFAVSLAAIVCLILFLNPGNKSEDTDEKKTRAGIAVETGTAQGKNETIHTVQNVAANRLVPGTYITFGSYEQNNNYSDGSEGIEWLVLTVEGDRALIVSRYGLDAKAYNDSFSKVTWENCTLRKWLNEGFYNSAFSDVEKGRIVPSKTVNASNREYNISGGNDTVDSVFMLSIDEAESYFNSDDDRFCWPTQYALANGASKNTYEEQFEINGDEEKSRKNAGHCWWWLRSPGYSADNAAYIFASGEIGYYGRNVNRSYVCIRPAVWITAQ